MGEELLCGDDHLLGDSKARQRRHTAPPNRQIPCVFLKFSISSVAGYGTGCQDKHTERVSIGDGWFLTGDTCFRYSI
jgi:hypothetical protein